VAVGYTLRFWASEGLRLAASGWVGEVTWRVLRLLSGLMGSKLRLVHISMFGL
jgi:hypothetical protein